jgi:Methylase of polypeptide chain release factors
LENDIKDYEPKVALDGGINGLSCIDTVITKSHNLIKRNGKLFIEIGNNQLDKIKKLLIKKNFYINKIAKDLGNNDRCILSTKR